MTLDRYRPRDQPLWEASPRYELPGRKTEALALVVGRVLRADQVKQQARLIDVDEVWRALLGDKADDALVRGLRRGTLHVGVSSSALLAELKGYHQDDLLGGLQRALPRRAIRAIRYTVRPRTTAPDGPPSDEASISDVEQADE